MLTLLGLFNQVGPQQPRRAEDRKAFDYIFLFGPSEAQPSTECAQKPKLFLTGARIWQFSQKEFIFGTQFSHGPGRFEQIGPMLLGQRQTLLPSPLGNIGMVARHQHGRNSLLVPSFWSRVMTTIQQTIYGWIEAVHLMTAFVI